jgi:hypothetical protein
VKTALLAAAHSFLKFFTVSQFSHRCLIYYLHVFNRTGGLAAIYVMNFSEADVKMRFCL